MDADNPLTVRLNEELAAVRAELTRLDGKCSTLAGLAGAALAFVVARHRPHHPVTAPPTSPAPKRRDDFTLTA